MKSECKGPEIIKDLQSPTGYFVKFRYQNNQADHVGLMGDWMFSDIHHSSRWKSARVWPWQWEKNMFPHMLLGLKKTPEALTSNTPQTQIDPTQFEFDWEILKLGLYEMRKTGNGIFEYTLPLPSGVFNYRFVLDMADGNPLKMVTVYDPENPPVIVWERPQLYSQVHVPFDPGRQLYDRSIELPVTGAKAGRTEIFQYKSAPVSDQERKACGVIYLPSEYDEKRKEALPVLYLSHGGGGNAGDWINQGALKNIMDHLILTGQVKPMAVVMMDNEVFHWDNFGKCIPNLTQYLIPWAESFYGIGGSQKMRAFAGFSAGGILAYEILASCPQLFNYIGVWSGGRRIDALPQKHKNPDIQVHIGAGRYDDAFYSFSYKLEDLLCELGISFTSYFPEGGHQWSVWRQLLEDFCKRVLWK